MRYTVSKLTPSKVFHDSLCIHFDPDIESYQKQTATPSQSVTQEDGRLRCCIEPRESKAHVGSKVVH
jgi:hypothetical protein